MTASSDSSPESQKRRDPIGDAMLQNGDRVELVLVRHGQQVDLMERDSPLSDLGRLQVEAVGRFLASTSIDAVWSSNLSRAHDTGLAIAAHHNLACTVEPELREIEIGRDVPDGKSIRDLLSEEQLVAQAERFMDTRRWDSFAMSESGAELRARVQPVIDRIIDTHRTGRVVVACHGGVINAIVGAHLGVEADFFFRAAHCSMHRLWATPDRMVLQSLNETHHLSADLTTT